MKTPAGVGTGEHSSGRATDASVPRRNAGLDIARARAAAGWPVHRLELRGKIATTTHGLHDATMDPAELRDMFAEDGNVGTPGTPTDLILDIDAPKADDRPDLTTAQRRNVAAERLAELHARFPATRDAPTVATPSGGFHVYLTLPERYVGAQQGTPGFISTGGFPRSLPKPERWGEVRGMGRAYVLVHGCETPEGIYAPLREPGAPGTAPEVSEDLIAWLLERPAYTSNGEAVGGVNLTPSGEPKELGDPEAYARGLLERVRARLGSIKSGRNESCYEEALTLGRWVGGYQYAGLAGLTEQDARAALVEAMQANGDYGDDPRKADGTIRNGLRAGMSSAYTVTEKPKRTDDKPYEQATQPRPQPSPNGEAARSPASSSTDGETDQPTPDRHPADPDVALLKLPQDDLGYAYAIAHQHHRALRKHAGLGFLAYDEDEHRHVTGEAAIARAHELAVLTQRSIMATAQRIDDEGKLKDWERYARSLRSKSKRDAALELMLRTRAVARDADIDGHDLEVNTPDGVVDLRTLELSKHDPRRIFTAVTRARYRPEAQHWAWDAVLGLLHQDGRAEYVQRVLGQAITGRVNREAFVFEGPKATGKTTLGEGLMTALGTDYAASVDPGTLLETSRNRSPGGPRSDLVALRSAHLALTSEPKGRLDGQTVKRMTGSDSITARAVHGRTPVTFRPRFTIVMLTNEVPSADWTDDALLSRLKLVPFRARPARIDPRVRAALVDDPEQDAIDALFTWAVHGAHLWIADGFSMGAEPEVVTNATRAYRVENDPFALWAEDRLRFDQADTLTTVSDLHSDYATWAGRNGITEPQRVEALGKWLKAQAEASRDIERKRTKNGSSWRGVRIVGPTG